MLSRFLIPACALVASFSVVACSDQSAPAEPVVAAPVPAVPVAMTAGVVSFDGVPEEGVTTREVLIVSKLDPTTREHLLRQRVLFEYKILGEVEPVAEESSTLPNILAEDATPLQAEMSKLRAGFPAIIKESVQQKGGRSKNFQSSLALYQSYEKSFKAIGWGDFDQSLQAISDKISSDNEAIMTRSKHANPDTFEQLRLTLDWLNQVNAHLRSYVALANKYIEAGNKYIELRVAGEEAEPEPTDWDGFVARYSHALIVEIDGSSDGEGTIQEDGSFEVVGQGTLVVRVEYGPVSAYFLPGESSEKRVTVSDRREFEK